MPRRTATPYERFQWERSAAYPDDPNLTLRYIYKLRGPLDIDRLERALRRVVEVDFPGLRNYFVEVSGQLQARMRPAPAQLLSICTSRTELFDLGGLDPRSQYLYRLAIWQEDEMSTLLRVDLSHLVCDGPSSRDFNIALSAAWRGVPTHSGTQVVPSTLMQNTPRKFWAERLRGRSLHQPWGFRHKAPEDSSQPVSVRHRLDACEYEKVRDLLRTCGATEVQLMIALTAALIGMREGGDDPLVVAHTVDARPSQGRLGCWTNVLPIWIKPEPAARSLFELLEEVRQQRREIRPFQEFPTLNLLELAESSLEQPDSRKIGPALNVVVNSSPATLPATPPQLDGLDVSLVERPVTANSSELAITFGSDDLGLHLAFDSHSRFVSTQSMDAFASDFIALLRFAIQEPRQPLCECDMSRPLAPVAVGAPRDAESPRALGTIIAEVARDHADEMAVVGEGRSMTYRDLLNTACGVAAVLAKGCQAVGVMVDRSPLIVVGYLGALLAGRPFVPLDPAQPDERLRRCVTVAEVDVVIVDGVTKERAGEVCGAARVIDIDQIAPSESLPAQVEAEPGRIAYIMFTSGSTGEPKGVSVTEDNLNNFLMSVADDPGIVPSDRILALTPVSFDISLLELLLPLTVGASLEVVSDTVRRDGRALAARLNQQRITVAQATPSTWRALRDIGWKATSPITILCGGEHLEEELARYLLSQGGVLYTMYGPTETTIWAGWHRVTNAREITLGIPARATNYYVLNETGASVGAGVVGELVVEGDSVALGYLNAPNTPFRPLREGVPAYWTGDLVRHYGEGRIVFVGRKDEQRKINGYRVEPGEVASVVRSALPDATVFVVVGSVPEPHLRCFVWQGDARTLDLVALRRWCEQVLPYYLVPKVVRRLRTIPMTPNGKSNIALMAEADLKDLDLWPEEEKGHPTPPHDAEDLIVELQQLVADELSVPAPDVDQPLGYQGISSLGFNVLAARINERFGMNLQAHDFYRFTTLSSIARVVATNSDTEPENARADRKRHALVPSPFVRTDNKQLSGADGERLAIIGMDAVLPGGPNPDEFWSFLMNGRSAVGLAGPERGFDDERAAFLDGVRGFDARFFTISPLEASWMDPRQRVLLQSCWHAFEDAGIAPSKLRGSRTGAYVAATGNDYAVLQARANATQAPHSLVGSSTSLLANRLSAYFDWSGPSITLDTACSGSLVALVHACRDLRSRVCDFAAVSGVNLILDRQITEGLDAAGLLSPRRRCAAFAESADGYVRGEGYGTFLVCRLVDALDQGYRVLAVIESAVENHGGRASSLTAPNREAQRNLLLSAYTPDLASRTSYIETHGTGTLLGDAVEIDALTSAWAELVPSAAQGTVRLGAVKSNVGHLEAAAGIASAVKVIKAFEHRALPANLHFDRPNPEISLSDGPFELITEAMSWDENETPTAGLSSFGFGGTNAHVVMSAMDDGNVVPNDDNHQLMNEARSWPFVLSGRSLQALRTLVQLLVAYLTSNAAQSMKMSDLSYTLCCGRDHFEYRIAVIASTLEELIEALTSQGDPERLRMTGEVVKFQDEDQACRDYLSGHDIDWEELFGNVSGRPISLPHYPFANTEFWFTDQ